MIRLGYIKNNRFLKGMTKVGLSVILTGSFAIAGEYDTAGGEWRTYGGDLNSHRYSALNQINAGNFNDLQIAWTFRPDNLGPTPDPRLQATPLMVDGVLYATAGTRRAAIALDGQTGELLWKFNIDEGERGQMAPRAGSGRGLSYWTDGVEERIIFVTPGYQMIALDKATGQPIESFGINGVVDLKREMDQEVAPTADVGLHATPLVVDDVIVVGAAHLPSQYPNERSGQVKGKIRGYDARTGERLWIFHPIPNAGEFGYETWLDGSAETTGNAGSWSQMSADPELGLVYVGIELPSGDWYGGHRPGDGLFGESIVALDIQTGERRWHYQTVRHGIWDMDIPSAAILADIEVDGKAIKALAQIVKHGWVFVLDRETGEPVWPIEDLPVPIGNVPTEYYAETQPHPTWPPAYHQQGVTIDDLIDFTPELRQEARELIADYELGESVFSPPAFSKWPRPLGTIISPTGDGAGQWPGGALDPDTNIMYLFSNMAYGSVGIVPGDPALTTLPMMRGQASPPDGSFQRSRLTVQGLPLLKPPYGQITAIDLDTGEIVWQRPHGETPDDVRDHPMLQGVEIPPTGSLGKVGVLVTKTLLIAGDGTATTDASGATVGWLRAYDKLTGEEVGKVRMDTAVTGSPMTYEIDGDQYLAVPVSSPDVTGRLHAFRLP